MTLHMRQPGPSVEIETMVNAAFSKSNKSDVYRNYFKRALDIFLVVMAAPAVLLVIAICAVMIAKDGGVPFYHQTRVGRFGKTFKMWKLRSMVMNADAALEEHLRTNTAARFEWDRNQKLRNDPRITKVGQILRKTSLDELPQLWNVLKGDMSLVGPRPMMVEQQSMYPGSAYYALRPGITGFWQVSVRNESSFAERASYDAEYLRKVTLAQDLTVMLKTVSVVTKATGC
ncbi:sugar transferase [Marivita cryptomonadis]|uniref:Sugar transferase n=2 Tax=Roseobacteraceae TaxID=2854170 RepID=A0A9Q2P9U4_9RHOB|nr:sugar transferase [Marivita cryptomonadis]MBM2331251.1 sugar transferase [Marivita cryptomonadis]MBM2340837.1 sugar transferase [Marivita cryptomonadis]MBM2345499.1 sugar transferase [Marivita cryptomonadis]MBM2350177.1 sugar transferase [Marivita cryptomonadis]